MGGKKGGPVLNSWIKEFCTLVFIQTIQAFIYAIIISVIVKMSFLSIEDVDDRNASMGIICVIALASVFKAEEMVKKIFGFGNSKADVRGAMSSLAKTVIARDFARKVLDNGSKVAGGIKAKTDAAKGRAKLKARMERDEATFKTGGDVALDSGENNTTNSTYQEYYEKAKQAKLNGDMEGYRTNMGIAAGMKKSGAGVPATSQAKDGKSIRDYNAMKDKYQDQLDELKKKRQEGTKQILRGLGETAGAVPGAVAGAIIGGADGNIDEALRGAGVGMGIGDTIGGIAASGVHGYASVTKSVPSKVGDAASAVNKIRQAVRDQQIEGAGLEKARKTAVEYYRQATKNRVSEKELQAMIKKANDASADNAN